MAGCRSRWCKAGRRVRRGSGTRPSTRRPAVGSLTVARDRRGGAGRGGGSRRSPGRSRRRRTTSPSSTPRSATPTTVEHGPRDEPPWSALDDDRRPPGRAVKQVGMTLVSTVGGASGPLYGTFSCAWARRSADADGRRQAFARRCGPAWTASSPAARPSRATRHVDALAPAVDALDAALAGGRRRRRAGRPPRRRDAGRDATMPMLARKGRASYLGERSVGHQDPGATTAALLRARPPAHVTARGADADGRHRGRLPQPGAGRAAVALAAEMLHGRAAPIEVAAGLDERTFGTDAVAIKDAIERVDGPARGRRPDGPGQRGAQRRARPRPARRPDGPRPGRCSRPAPLVEGLIVAAVGAPPGGASRAEVAAEARGRR